MFRDTRSNEEQQEQVETPHETTYNLTFRPYVQSSRLRQLLWLDVLAPCILVFYLTELKREM